MSQALTATARTTTTAVPEQAPLKNKNNNNGPQPPPRKNHLAAVGGAVLGGTKAVLVDGPTMVVKGTAGAVVAVGKGTVHTVNTVAKGTANAVVTGATAVGRGTATAAKLTASGVVTVATLGQVQVDFDAPTKKQQMELLETRCSTLLKRFNTKLNDLEERIQVHTDKMAAREQNHNSFGASLSQKKLKQWNAQKSQVQIALNDLTSLRLDIQEENAQRKTATLHNQPHVPFFILQNPTPLVRILLVLQEEEGDKLVVKNKGYQLEGQPTVTSPNNETNTTSSSNSPRDSMILQRRIKHPMIDVTDDMLEEDVLEYAQDVLETQKADTTSTASSSSRGTIQSTQTTTTTAPPPQRSRIMVRGRS